jgi:AraC family transcriptional regulator of adaptative response/methylated-DNA-[protein]-cysteine methyltransferase
MPPSEFVQQAHDYQRIEQAISYLRAHYQRQPDLRDVARHVHLSEYHFQRLFTRWAGISPKRFLQYLTLEHAKRLLKESRSLLDATFESGLSSPGRLHDLFVTIEAMTPGEYKKDGEGLTIHYGFHPTPFGECLLAVTQRGICGLGFVSNGKRGYVVQDLKMRWPGARFSEKPELTNPLVDRIFNPSRNSRRNPLPLFLKGTNFQIKVWEALLKIPEGKIVSYEDLAHSLGKPKASRAVGNAVAKNPVSYIIPCHRVIRREGATGKYHWGAMRKQALLGREWAQTEK